MNVGNLNVKQIMLDGGTQARAKLDFAFIAEIAKKIKSGETIAPVIVFFDGSKYWLADGFHRARAALDANITTIEAEIRSGNRRDALLFGIMQVAQEDTKRTDADKRRAVEIVLNDDAWSQADDHEIAKQLRIETEFVSNFRKLRKQSSPHGTNETNNLNKENTKPIENTYSVVEQNNLPEFDETNQEEEILSDPDNMSIEHDVSLIPSAERCMLIDPYLASPKIIANIIDKLQFYYREKTGKYYIHQNQSNQ